MPLLHGRSADRREESLAHPEASEREAGRVGRHPNGNKRRRCDTPEIEAIGYHESRNQENDSRYFALICG